MLLFFQQVVNGLVIGSTYAVVAVGFALVFTVLRVVNFAHPEIFMIGSFRGAAGAALVSSNVVVVLALGAIGAGLVGLVLERAVIRPLRGRDVLMTLIATLGVAIMLQNGMAVLEGPDPVPYPTVISQEAIYLGGVGVSARQLANFAISI